MSPRRQQGQGSYTLRLEVYSPRWGHIDRYKISKTDNGWYVAHISINGECDKTGAPYLFENFRQDEINYSPNLGMYMKTLWDKSTSCNMSEDEIQEQLDLLGKWLQTDQKASPGGIF